MDASIMSFRNRGWLMTKWFFLAICLIACQKKESRSGKEKPEGARAPEPNESTYFPLFEGSYWVYEDFIEGEKQGNSREVDSVKTVRALDSGVTATVIERKADGSLSEIQYLVNAKGLVSMKRYDGAKVEPFSALHPTVGENIGKLIVEKCPSTENCFLLQPYAFEADTLSEIQRMSWNGFYFEKGIGLTAHAGPELSSELVEYRIGLNGPKIRTGK
jgi:hypothetical protein